MLSAKKVKLHGMQDNRWTTKDKITQYKGLINLFTRDSKIMQIDTQVANKKQQQLLKQLHKDIVLNRQKLDNAFRGDKQQIRNVLQEHRSMQLAYQELHALQIIAHIHQDNFNKRKELDRLTHRMKLRTEALIHAKLQLAELEDRLQYEAPGTLPSEIQAKIVTGQVQDAILKQDAAISVRHIYKKILCIMKKDAIYFDAVLNTLRMDSKLQGKCMFRTVQLGQLATEYLDDRKNEFMQLEKAVKKDMKGREQELETIRQCVGGLNKKLRMLIRRDSDLNVTDNFNPQYRTISELDMLNDLEFTKEIFERLQNVAKVTHFEKIFPCIQEQKRQAERLGELVRRGLENRETLLNKSNHAELMYYDMLYTMNETTFEYKENKKQLKTELDEAKQRIKDTMITISNRGKLMVMIRRSLQQILGKCRPVQRGIETKKTVHRKISQIYIDQPEEVEEDGINLINALSTKLQLLANATANILPLQGAKKDTAEMLYQKLIFESSKIIDTKVKRDEAEALIDTISVEDAQIPTREFIKATSRDIVQQATHTSEEEEAARAGARKGKK
ncbi:coiled-coil domain-containing protein [Holotrichia oblita]|uniref:Coiled-coil domain-containing protein n=1 Tax=Holotrichia oblita TaxID=644536 RepID=A0ACB9TU67_HOLOL|nr:coiled-coil domain-containing protein [Holotrichia oblita]